MLLPWSNEREEKDVFLASSPFINRNLYNLFLTVTERNGPAAASASDIVYC